MAKRSFKEDILEAGLRVMLRKGYAAASVRDVVAEAGVPQGSFTNHFRSKEAFSRDVLDLYFQHVRDLVSLALDDESLKPRQRLQRYLHIITGRLESDDFKRGCLIGDFSLEAAPVSEMLRARLSEIFLEWRDRFADCIREAQSSGEIDATFTPEDLADFLLSSWEGAIMRMKVERSSVALERFQKIAFATVFKGCT
ncbi:TetR family transcriptional regulator C-terminal domain-containing protein [Bradyrhizobium liaoningense]|jgi:TetR/AcrR family transcriptional repressor of nem operon